MIPLILTLAAAVLAGAIPLQLHLDTRRGWMAETDTWHGADVHQLPAARRNLAYPLPLTLMDLPARWETAGRHRLGVAPGTQTQQAAWNTPTGQFWLIVEALGDLDEPCSHCATPEDGERAHVGCPGCACPCGAVPPLPEGVEGHALAGGTR